MKNAHVILDAFLPNEKDSYGINFSILREIINKHLECSEKSPARLYLQLNFKENQVKVN